MLHRRLLRDDFLGVGEALNEPGLNGQGLITRGKHRVLLTKPSTAARLHRDNGMLMMLAPMFRYKKRKSALNIEKMPLLMSLFLSYVEKSTTSTKKSPTSFFESFKMVFGF